ncbi:MAG: hypothetical protein KQI35_09835 [Bacteroidetes bacterium]|nr:hypothetical protein [Bacteroidota bacterium]
MKFSLKNILAKRKSNDFANSGFLSGIIAGIVLGIFAFITTMLSKKSMLKELSATIEDSGIAIPYGADTLYLISLLITPCVIVLICSIIGLFFGLVYKKTKHKNPIKVYLFGIIFGAILGSISSFPANITTIIIVNILAWLMFSIVFINLTSKMKYDEKK